MDRRQFHKAVLTGAAAAAGLPGATATPAVGGMTVPPLHAQDALPPGAAARFGNTRFWHYAAVGNEGVSALAFSPDGRLLAALGKDDATVSLWEVPGGNLLRQWQGDDAGARARIAFSPDGRLLATATREALRLWDPSTGALVRTLGDPRFSGPGLAFSPDGRLIAGVEWYRGRALVWEVETGAEVARFEAGPLPGWPEGLVPQSSDLFNGVAFSADGRRLAVGATEQILRTAESPEGKELLGQLMTLAGRKSMPAGTQTWIEGKHYVYDSRGRVWCWDLATGREVARLGGHAFGVLDVDFLADGRLVSCAEDGQLWLWDVAAGERLAERAPAGGFLHATFAVLIGDGRHAWLYGKEELRLIDLGGGAELLRVPVGRHWHGQFSHPTVSADLRWVVTDSQGRFRLWDTTAAADVSPPERHSGDVRAAAFTPDGRVATATAGEVLLWDAQGKFLHQFDGKCQLLSETLALSPDGRGAACARRLWCQEDPERSDVLTWDWQTAEARSVEVRNVTALAWLPDGEALLLGTKQEGLCRLDLGSGRRERLADGLQGMVKHVTVSADGRWAAALGKATAVHVWELSGGYHRLQVPAVARKKYTDYSFPWGQLAFAPDGRSLALFTERGDICVGPVQGPTLPLAFSLPPNHDPEFCTSRLALAWLPDGRLLAAMSYYLGEDGVPGPTTIRVFDVLAGREVWAAEPFERHVGCLAISADGRQLASGMGDGTAVRWPLEGT